MASVFIFETDRLLLRTLEIEDLDAVMTFWVDEEVMKYCGGAGNREREEGMIKFYMNLQKERGYSPYAVILKESSELIGVCGFTPPYDNEHVELMYHFAKKYWGKGFATEAATACIHYARKNLMSEKIIASIDLENPASERVLKKAGFTYIGLKWDRESKQNEPYFELEL